MIADASRGNSARLGRECIVTGERLLGLPDSDISEVNCDTGAWFLGLLDRDIGDSVLGNLSYLYIAIASL